MMARRIPAHMAGGCVEARQQACYTAPRWKVSHHLQGAMDKIVVRGGRSLEGTIEAAGSKNAALPILTAAILAPGEYRFTHVPLLRDVTTMARLLETLGATFHQDGHTLHLDTSRVEPREAPYDLVKTM